MRKVPNRRVRTDDLTTLGRVQYQAGRKEAALLTFGEAIECRRTITREEWEGCGAGLDPEGDLLSEQLEHGDFAPVLQMARGTKVLFTRENLLGRVARKLVEAKQCERALALAKELTLPGERASLLIHIAAAQTEAAR